MSITLIIIIITALVSYKCFNDRVLFSKLMYNPYLVERQNDWKRILTHGFIHADTTHLFFNMFSFYLFGEYLEAKFEDYFGFLGKVYFVLLYLGAIVAASIKTFFQHKDNPSYNAVGASGAVSAVVFAFILINPTIKLGFFFVPPFLPGWIFALLYLAYSQYMSKKQMDNVGHEAHIWGAIFGLVYTAAIKPDLVMSFMDKILA